MKDPAEKNCEEEKKPSACPWSVWFPVLVSFLTLFPKMLAGFLYLIVPPIERPVMPPNAALLILCESGSLLLLGVLVLGGADWARQLFMLVAALAVFFWLFLAITGDYSYSGAAMPTTLSVIVLLAALFGFKGENAREYFRRSGTS